MNQINKITDFIPLAGSAQSAKIDHSAQKDYDLSAEVLMESAGALCAREVLLYLKKQGNKIHKERNQDGFSVLVLCGPGHNGGDGLVLARHLLSEGISVKIFCPETKGSVLVEKQKERLRVLSDDLLKENKQSVIKTEGEKCSVIVDALFGVGLDRNIENFYADLIQWINSTDQYVISLDTPSGLNVDTGQLRGQAVKADLTLSFGLAKPGFYLLQGPVHTGQLKVFSIGFPFHLLREKANTHFLIKKSWVSSRLPERSSSDHKACQGHLLVLAGREGFWGAGQLTSLSAYRMGVGYVTWARNIGDEYALEDSTFSTDPLVSKEAFQSASNKRVENKKMDQLFLSPTGSHPDIPDVLTQTLSDPDLLKNKTAVVIGPGLGVGKETKNLLLTLKKTKLPVVVDADAFTVCVRENLFPLPFHWVLTPHSGELARFFNITGREVDQDRCSYAIRASQKTGCPVLLKGFYSVLARNGKCWIIPAGNSALAKAGTGDVLAGFIGALMARFLDTFSATAVAAFTHGLLAEEWTADGRDKDSLMAQDLRDILPFVLQKLRSEKKYYESDEFLHFTS